MLSRRALIAALIAAPAAGCSKQGFQDFSTALYTDLKKVALLLEAAVKKAAVDLPGAVHDMLDYAVPCCRLVVSMDALLAQLVAAGTLPASSAKVQTAQTTLHGLASNVAIAQAAQTGSLPGASDAVTIVTAIIQGVALIMQLTSGKVAPTAAAQAA